MCLNCQYVFKLRREERTCYCGRVTGAYKQDGDQVWHNGHGILLALRNDEFRRVLAQNKPMTSAEAEGPMVFMYRDSGKVEIRTPALDPLPSANAVVRGGCYADVRRSSIPAGSSQGARS